MLESDGILGQRFEDRRSWSRYPSSSRFFRSSCVLAEHGSLKRLQAYCGSELPRYMQPARIDVRRINGWVRRSYSVASIGAFSSTVTFCR